jgi:hypothetical protein
MNPSKSVLTMAPPKSGPSTARSTHESDSTGPYNTEFEQLMHDNGIYMPYRAPMITLPSTPQNMGAIRERLAQRRPSLSASGFSEEDFWAFRERATTASSEDEFMQSAMSFITSGKKAPFDSDLAEVHLGGTSRMFVGFGGAPPTEIDSRVCEALADVIILRDDQQRPAAPSYFVQINKQEGSNDVEMRQAANTAAVGAQCMFELQNFGKNPPVYDDNAYSIVVSYHAPDATLHIHVSQPRRSAVGQKEFLTTRLGTFNMTQSLEDFRQGAMAVRNARDLCKEWRDAFIADANSVAEALPPPSKP